jgi:putative NADH-flavin reductase
MMSAMKVCIVGASGKLGQYMVQHALDRGYEVVGVCRKQSVGKLDAFKGRITIMSGATNDRAVIKRAVAGCDGVLTVLVPWGHQHYSSGTAQAVLDYARPNARLIFSCGWHITYHGQDVYPPAMKREETIARWISKL